MQTGQTIQRRFSAILATTAILLLAINPSDVHAATTSRLDPRGDAPPRIDLVRLSFTNSTTAVAGRMLIAGLAGIGRADLVIGPPTNSDEAFVARVRRDSNGRLVKRFFASSVGGTHPVACRFAASWRPRVDRIRISVPHRCIPYPRAVYVNGVMRLGNHVDFGDRPARHLPRG